MKTFYLELSLAFLILLGLTGVGFVAISLWTTRTHMEEVTQRMNLEVAPHLVEEVDLLREGTINREGLKHVFHMMMVINPSIEIYLLDPDGVILAFSAPPDRVKAERVDLNPILAFIDGPERLPLTGDDPRSPGRAQVFSAAPIGPRTSPLGYLYVVLAGERFASAVELLDGSHILRTSLAALAILFLLATVAGLIVFAALTRRLRRLRRAMIGFEASDFSEPPRIQTRPRPRDELDDLTATFERLAQAMSAQLEKVRQSDVLRRQLVANISHDLRTPLASLTAFVETLLVEDGSLSPATRRQYLTATYRHGRALGDRVARLFELAELEARRTEAQLEPCAAGELLQDIAQKFELRARDLGVDLDLDLDPGVPLVRADLGLLERVLDNLIDNALRHTPAGGTVTLSLRPGAEFAQVAVIDDGEGIASDELPFVFDRFYRCRASDRTHGSGLGLAIARHIVQLHGTELEVESELGRGTAFAFALSYDQQRPFTYDLPSA